MKIFLVVIAVLVGLALVIGLSVSGVYNRLVTLRQATDAAWAQVENVYQRRADLVPNLVNTVAGAANFEKSTLTEITAARAAVGRVLVVSRNKWVLRITRRFGYRLMILFAHATE